MGVIVLDELDAADVSRWARTAVDLLSAHRREIDALNVFPVPDGDTGSNMLQTLRAGADALAAASPVGAAGALDVMSSGATHGAIGNSGFILSQILRGLADAAPGDGGAYDGAAVSAGLDLGATLARAAVVTPVEGTILTVARAAAGAAHGVDLAAVVAAALAAATEALQQTTSQLAQLAEAGVVDAGGRGLVVLLHALARIVTGEVNELRPAERSRTSPARASRAPRHAAAPSGEQVARESGSADYGFEVQYLLEATASDVQRLRATLSELGDSVVLVGMSEGTYKVHVHVNDVGAAIEAGVEAGRPHEISVERFADQAQPGAEDAELGHASAVLAIAPGAGLAHLFDTEGVHVIGESWSPDAAADSHAAVEEVVAAIEATGARELVLLPNASQITGVAEAAAARVRRRGVRVSVVPTRSPVQGLAAIAVHDAGRRFDDDVVAMAEAAAATRFAEVTIAASEGLTAVGICQPGDILGLIDGDVVAIGRGLLAVAFTLVDRLLGVGAELMTVLVGADAPVRAGKVIEAHIRERAPLTDVSVYQGGQPDHPVIIGAE